MASYLYFLVFFVLKFTITSATDFGSNWFYDDGVAYSSNFTLYATTIKKRGVGTSNGNNKNVGRPENVSAANRKENCPMDVISTPSTSPSSLPKVPIFNGHQKKDQFFLKNLENESKHEYRNESLSLSLDQVKPFDVSLVLLPIRHAADVVVLEANVMSEGRSPRSAFIMSRESWGSNWLKGYLYPKWAIKFRPLSLMSGDHHPRSSRGAETEAHSPQVDGGQSHISFAIALLPAGGAKSVSQMSNIMTKFIRTNIATTGPAIGVCVIKKRKKPDQMDIKSGKKPKGHFDLVEILNMILKAASFMLDIMWTTTRERNPIHLVFTLQWYGGRVTKTCQPCYHLRSEQLTIHGLWPSVIGASLDTCDTKPLQMENLRTIVVGLEQQWPDFRCPPKNGREFWNGQGIKHGTCSRRSQKAYFASALYLKLKFNLTQVLALDGITPKHSQPYKLTTVQDSILNSIGFHPLTIRCTGVPNALDLRPNLHEVNLCVHFYRLDFIQCPIPYYSNSSPFIKFRP